MPVIAHFAFWRNKAPRPSGNGSAAVEPQLAQADCVSSGWLICCAMAAKPIERFVKRQIQEQGGWPRILERIASGETVADVARTLKRPDGQEISRSFFSHMLHADDARSAAVLKARSEGADAMVDHGLHLVDTAAPDRDSINKAKVQAELRLKVAGFVNREQWGEAKQPMNVSVNVASLHVDALRHRIVSAADSDVASAHARDTEEDSLTAGQRALAKDAEWLHETPSQHRNALK